MGIQTYIIKSSDVIHHTSVDLVKRMINVPLHFMQYDNTLPIVAVELFKDSQPYILPNTGKESMFIRWGLPDRSFVYKPVLGCSADRHTVYFAVDEQMVFFYGELNQTIEYIINEQYTDSNGIVYPKRVLDTSYLKIIIDRNPIQKGDIAAVSRYAHLVEIVRPNPTIGGEEPILGSIGIGDQNYIIDGGGSTSVIPNPPITEEVENLHSLKIVDDKYSIFSAQKAEMDELETITEIDGLVFVKLVD